MSILQRRLASSTWAILKSLERRGDKIAQLIQEIKVGLLDEQGLRARQQKLPDISVRDTKTGDEEEAEDGFEESEQQDKALEEATAAETLEELIREHAEIKQLVALARRVYDQRNESKFEELWLALARYPDTKALIFTEFRDTLDFLVDRLQGKGLTGKIAQIHGGMPYKEREKQTAFFRQEARIMIATDAAGEGINLQFCWLLVNYDIPWNPARLEQRMGRVHRYKQTHDVVLLNITSKDTREGRVLKVLLDKLANIREQLGNDKVFDIIGQQFTSKSLLELIFEAVIEGKEAQVTEEFERLDAEQTRTILVNQERKVNTSEVRGLLKALRYQTEAAEMRRMMPAYIRRFFQLAAPRVGIGIKGDIETIFWLDPYPLAATRALATYPETIQQRLTFDREQARPDLTQEPRAIYLHPGEPVFEVITDLFLGQYEQEGMRGGLFFDAEVTEPYIFYLARISVLRDAVPQPVESPAISPSETVDEQMVGLRRYVDGHCELAPAHLLLTLFPYEKERPWPETETELWRAINDTTPAELFLLQEVGLPALEKRRLEERQQIPERVNQLRTAFNLRKAELYRQRNLLKDATNKQVPAAESKLRKCEAELSDLDRQRREAEAELRTSVDRLCLGAATIYAQAMVLSLSPEEARERQDTQSEKIAVAEVIRREEVEGSVIEDVSAPHLKAGFDLKVLRANGEMRYVEVKGCKGEAAVELTANEWAQAANHRDRYWLYVVYNCSTVPTLYRVPDPFGRLIAEQTGAVRINAAQIKAAAEK
jgi:hypothetical protein